jgi:hypothetical protein
MDQRHQYLVPHYSSERADYGVGLDRYALSLSINDQLSAQIDNT